MQGSRSIFLSTFSFPAEELKRQKDREAAKRAKEERRKARAAAEVGGVRLAVLAPRAN